MNKLIIIIAMLCISTSLFAQEETAQQKEMAKMMAEYMDMAWDNTPSEGFANLRILMVKKGKPFAGSISSFGKFSYRLDGPVTVLMSFNPNENGRFVHEEIKPGKYALLIEGKDEMEGFKFEQLEIEIKAGDITILEIEVE